jgi:tetratricopeptide (TPR) repeat protein
MELLFVFGEEETGGRLEEMCAGMREEGVQSRRLETVLGRVLMALDRHEEAETVMLEALSAYGPNKWLHYYLAEVYESGGRFRQAEKHLKACLKLDPQDPDLMNFLGYLYAEENVKLDKAERLLERALTIDPDSGFYLDSLGWVYYRKAKKSWLHRDRYADRAIELIRQAVLAMDTDDAILRDHLGDAYFLKGDVDKAVAEWKRALRLDPELEGVQEKIEKHRPAGKR